MTRRRTILRGFTVVEMLVSMALLALIMLAAALAIQAAQTSHEYNSEKADLVSRARGILERIAHDARRAKSIAVPDEHTLVITTADDDLRTYALDPLYPANLTYVQTVDIVASAPVVMTGYVQTFIVTDQAPACQIQIVLTGVHAQAQATITVTPRKSLF